MPLRDRPLFPVAALLFSATLWGLSWWPLKFFHRSGIEGAPLMLVAYGGVGLVLLPWMWRERHAWWPERGWVAWMIVLGGYGNLAFAYAMIFGDVIRSMMLFYLAPVWGVLGGRFLLGEVIDARRRTGVVLALAGAFMVLGGWRVASLPPRWTDLMALTAGVTFALNNVLCRRAQRVPLVTKGTVVFVGCGMLSGAVMLWGHDPWPVLPASTWELLLLFSFGGLLIATLGSQWGVTRLEAGRASVILVFELLVAVVSAALVGGERLDAGEVAGGAMILAAALLEATRASRDAVSS